MLFLPKRNLKWRLYAEGKIGEGDRYPAETVYNTFTTETFKGKTHFAVTLQPVAVVYNSNKLNSSARVAKVFNERIIERIRAFKGPAQESGIDGLKFSAEVAYRNFVDEPTSHQDQLEIYLPLELIMKFTEADITTQQLVDGSVVLLNGNRIQILLTEG